MWNNQYGRKSVNIGRCTNIYKRILKKIIIILIILAFGVVIYVSGKESNEQNSQPKAKPLVINSDTYYSEEYIKLSTVCENVQKNLNISTDETLYAVTSDDEDNIDLLARLVYSEVGNLNDEAQIATASVIMNRVNSNAFPNSIYGVIYQEGQYAVTQNGAINNSPSEQAYNNAKFVYENGSQIPSNVVYQAEFAQGSEAYKKIDNTYFCYE